MIDGILFIKEGVNFAVLPSGDEPMTYSMTPLALNADQWDILERFVLGAVCQFENELRKGAAAGLSENLMQALSVAAHLARDYRAALREATGPARSQRGAQCVLVPQPRRSKQGVWPLEATAAMNAGFMRSKFKPFCIPLDLLRVTLCYKFEKMWLGG